MIYLCPIIHPHVSWLTRQYRPVAQIPLCTICYRNVHMCAHFCYKMVYRGMHHFVTEMCICVHFCYKMFCRGIFVTHWDRVGKLTIIGSDNGLSPGRRQAIIWTNAEILLIRTLGTDFSEILSGIHTFSFKKMHLKMSSAKWRQFGLGLNLLNIHYNPRTMYKETYLLIISSRF